MTTHYDQVPTLEERVRASRLIVVGRVQSIELLKRERIGEIEEQQAIAHVAIVEVLRGAPKTRRVGVRFILSGGQQVRTGTRPFREGQRVVLLLVPDVGRDARPNTYVAYLQGHYALTAGDSFAIDTGATRSSRTTLKKLRGLIRVIAAEEAAESRSWARHEQQLVKRRVLPPITELPQPEYGSGPTTVGPRAPARSRVSRRK
jgi:hypothetical protein